MFSTGLMTNFRAIICCVLAKIIAGGLAAISLLIDKNFLTCEVPFPLFFTRSSIVILVAYPMLVVGAIVGIVSIYLGYKIVHIGKSVSPTVTLGKGARKSIRRVEDQVDVIVVEEVEENAPKNNSGESNIIKAVTMTKTALDINYVIILSSLGNVLQAILSITYRACSQTGRSCEDYLYIYHSFFPLRILFTFIGCFLFLKKIRKSE